MKLFPLDLNIIMSNVIKKEKNMNLLPQTRFALFGGSFDPIHKGHILLAEYIQSYLELNKVIFIPVNQSPFKETQEYAQSFHRLNMINLALESCPQFECSQYEINQKDPVNYTFKTIKYFRSVFPFAKLYFVIGEDNLAKIGEWKNIYDILNDITFIIYPRCRQNLSYHSFQVIKNKPSSFIFLDNAPTINTSSTLIKQLIERRVNTGSLLHPKVYDYIVKNKIYLNNET
jgi:nicotinate-nucleotide adenylyltransferase